MKRSRSGRELNSVENNRSWSELPIEVWRMILSLVSFDDQVKFRAVCRDWLDVITTLPEFKDTNCLVLDCCTLTEDDEPVTTILNSQLRFGSMVVGKSLSVAAFPSLTTFFSRLGETVTNLDLSNTKKQVGPYLEIDLGWTCDLDNFRSIVENLHLFKVLQHLKIDSLEDWFRVATSTWSPFINVMVMFILRKDRANIFTRAIVEGVLDGPNMDVFEQRLFLKRHRNLILEKITDNLDRINEELCNGNQLENETVDLITEQIKREIAEIDKSIDLSSRINTSVRVLSFSVGHHFESSAALIIEKMFQLAPNVQEFNIRGATTKLFPVNEELKPLIKTLSTKITAIDVYAKTKRLDELEKLNLSNVKHLKILQPRDTNRNHYHEESLRRFVNLFPKIESMSIRSFKLPNRYFDFVTRINLLIETEQLQLSSLVEFKNLKSLSLFKFSETPLEQGCFFGHQTTSLKSIKELEFNNRDKKFSLCCQCLEAFLQSLPNLDILDFNSIVKQNYADIIFKNQPNLKRLKIVNELRKGSSSFKPDNKWPEMKRLRSLTLTFNKIIGNEDAWCNFGQKLQILRNFEVVARQSVDLVKFIRSETRPMMPALLRAQILVSNVRLRYKKPITTTIVERNGRKIVIEKFSEK